MNQNEAFLDFSFYPANSLSISKPRVTLSRAELSETTRLSSAHCCIPFTAIVEAHWTDALPTSVLAFKKSSQQTTLTDTDFQNDANTTLEHRSNILESVNVSAILMKEYRPPMTVS